MESLAPRYSKPRASREPPRSTPNQRYSEAAVRRDATVLSRSAQRPLRRPCRTTLLNFSRARLAQHLLEDRTNCALSRATNRLAPKPQSARAERRPPRRRLPRTAVLQAAAWA